MSPRQGRRKRTRNGGLHAKVTLVHWEEKKGDFTSLLLYNISKYVTLHLKKTHINPPYTFKKTINAAAVIALDEWSDTGCSCFGNRLSHNDATSSVLQPHRTRFQSTTEFGRKMRATPPHLWMSCCVFCMDEMEASIRAISFISLLHRAHWAG